MKTKKRADILVRKLEGSKPGRWFDFIAAALRDAQNDILAKASERLEAAEAVSPAEAAAIIRELMHK